MYNVVTTEEDKQKFFSQLQAGGAGSSKGVYQSFILVKAAKTVGRGGKPQYRENRQVVSGGSEREGRKRRRRKAAKLLTERRASPMDSTIEAQHGGLAARK